MQSEEQIEAAARAIILADGGKWAASDEEWKADVARYREMCAKFPNYADGASLITDAFRRARAALTVEAQHTPASIPDGGDDQIKHMVNRFLMWKLPENFNPDGGISFKRPNYHPSIDATPSGTNLFDYTQATAMVRHMLEGLPAQEEYRHRCFICGNALKVGDICAMDITEGICHAACLEGSPVVDLESGEEIEGGVADTFLYEDDDSPDPAEAKQPVAEECCGKPVHVGSPEGYTLECCERFVAPPVTDLKAENERLRGIISDCASALPNGAHVSAQCSLEFMELLPEEIRSVCSAMRKEG